MGEPSANSAESAPRRMTTNFILLAAGQVGAGLLSLAVLRLLATRLAPEGFGRACFAESMLIYFIVLANLGLDMLGIREVARRPEAGGEYVRRVNSLRLVLAVAASAVLAASALVMPVDATTQRLVLLYALTLLPLGVSLEWFFQGVQQMQFCGLFLVVREGVLVGLVWFLVRGPGDILLVPVCYGASRVAAVAFLWIVYLRRHGPIRLTMSGLQWRELARDALPIGLSQFAGVAIYPMATTLLGFMAGNVAVGEYNAATRPLLFLLILGGAYATAVFPVAAGLFDHDRARLGGFVRIAAGRAIVAALAVGVGGTLLGAWVVEVLYPGGQYAECVPAFIVFSWAVAAAIVNGVYSKALLACNGQRAYLVVVVFQFLVCFGVTVALIPRLGALGAAIATCAAETAGLAAYWRAYRAALRK